MRLVVKFGLVKQLTRISSVPSRAHIKIARQLPAAARTLPYMQHRAPTKSCESQPSKPARRQQASYDGSVHRATRALQDVIPEGREPSQEGPQRAIREESPAEASSADQQAQSRGREVKRAREHTRKKGIPDVSLSALHDLWEEKDRRRELRDEVHDEVASAGPPAGSEDAALFSVSQHALEHAQAVAVAKAEHVALGNRRLLSESRPSRRRGLSSARPNGVSELPDPEAAEYLSTHQSQDLGADVVTAARLHYLGTQAGPVHPLSTDQRATTEEHATQGDVGALSSRANRPKESEEHTAQSSSSLATESRQNAARSSPSKQEGYPWYTDFPPPGFPDSNLTKTNHTLYANLKSLIEEQPHLTVSKAHGADERSASTSGRDGLRSPGDGGELPPPTTIFRALGVVDSTPAQTAREQLDAMRAQAKVWMSRQEASLIESFLEPGDVMLEYGAGYSTMWYSQFVKAYYSIEHDASWFDEIRHQINSTRKNVHLQVAPVKKGDKGWGGGFEEGTYSQFEHYITAVDKFKVVSFDKVLVDGRARASCAEYVLKFLHPGSLVFIHDYQDRYFYHGTAEKFFDKVAETYDGQSLIVLRPKPEALRKAAKDAVASLAAS